MSTSSNGLSQKIFDTHFTGGNFSIKYKENEFHFSTLEPTSQRFKNKGSVRGGREDNSLSSLLVSVFSNRNKRSLSPLSLSLSVALCPSVFSFLCFSVVSVLGLPVRSWFSPCSLCGRVPCCVLELCACAVQCGASVTETVSLHCGIVIFIGKSITLDVKWSFFTWSFQGCYHEMVIFICVFTMHTQTCEGHPVRQ